jgi:hypothetical protein
MSSIVDLTEHIPTSISGLHILIADEACDDAREKRKLLRHGVEELFSSWNWQSLRSAHGHRICCMEGGRPAPPVSVSYSGAVALLLVSNDWHSVGVDIEITTPGRRRYFRIIEGLCGNAPADPLASFVRAEAWAKATGHGFSFGASFFLGSCGEAGQRYDGRIVYDLDLRYHLPKYVTSGRLVAAAFCIDASAPLPSIHPYRRISAAGRRTPPCCHPSTIRGNACY